MECLSGETKWPQFIREHFEKIREPFTAGIELLPQCNFKCIHCYVESDRESETESLRTDEIKKIIDTLTEHNCLEVYFTGGECLLHKDFPEIYIYAKEKGMFVSVLTNGSLITEKHIQLWTEYPPELISITMYGASAKTYEEVTGNPKGYQMFCDAVELLKNHHMPFELKCIGMKQNLEDIAKIRSFIRKQGIKNSILAWDIRPMNDGSKNPISCRVSAEEAFAAELQDPERKAFWDKLAFDNTKTLKTEKQKENKQYPCAVAFQFVFITHDGYMQSCVKATEPRYNLRCGNFDEGWKRLGEWYVDKVASDYFKCSSCEKFRYCGQCSAAFMSENGNPEVPVEFYCELGELRKKYMEKIVSEHVQK